MDEQQNKAWKVGDLKLSPTQQNRGVVVKRAGDAHAPDMTLAAFTTPAEMLAWLAERLHRDAQQRCQDAEQEGKPTLPGAAVQPSTATFLSEVFCTNWLSAPNACAHLLNTALDPDHMRAAAKQIEGGRIQWSPPEYMEGATFGQMIEPMTTEEACKLLCSIPGGENVYGVTLARHVNEWLKAKQESRK